MGVPLDRDRYDEDDFRRFAARLEEGLSALREVLGRPGFGAGEPTIGAELELCLVDARGRPVPRNREILATANDPRLTLEIDRFNLEINARPAPLAGRPFSFLADELTGAMDAVVAAASAHGAGVAAIGILPTLSVEDLGPGALTDAPRYRALAEGLRRTRSGSYRVRVEGEDTLDLEGDAVALEGANTSFQVHLRVPPAAFADAYNAAQFATAPALAVAANAPTLLGRLLWDETRIALFRQVADDRNADADAFRPARVSFGHGWVREGAFELFAESVALHAPIVAPVSTESPVGAPCGADDARCSGAPALSELRAHLGTVWRWNRAVYDACGEGHVRIEMRALPAGPTVADMTANAAFLLGLTLGLAPDVRALLHRMTFGQARQNFYAAARHGLAADLLWPTASPPSPSLVPAADLVERLLPVAERGLLAGGVDPSEARRSLDVIALRVQRRQNGAAWQRATLRALERRLDRTEALAGMFARYRALAEGGLPVGSWPAGG